MQATCNIYFLGFHSLIHVLYHLLILHSKSQSFIWHMDHYKLWQCDLCCPLWLWSWIEMLCNIENMSTKLPALVITLCTFFCWIKKEFSFGTFWQICYKCSPNLVLFWVCSHYSMQTRISNLETNLKSSVVQELKNCFKKQCIRD